MSAEMDFSGVGVTFTSAEIAFSGVGSSFMGAEMAFSSAGASFTGAEILDNRAVPMLVRDSTNKHWHLHELCFTAKFHTLCQLVHLLVGP